MSFELQKTAFQLWKQLLNPDNTNRNNPENYNDEIFEDNVHIVRDLFATSCYFERTVASNQNIVLIDSCVYEFVIALGFLKISNQEPRPYSCLFAANRISLANVKAKYVYSANGNILLKSSIVSVATAVKCVVLKNSEIQELIISPKLGEKICSVDLAGDAKIQALTVCINLSGNTKPAGANDVVTLIVSRGSLNCHVDFQNCKGRIQLLAGAIFAGTTNGCIIAK